MIDLYQLQSEIFNFDFRLEIENIPLDTNYERFEYVDGEEGDHGIIDYYHEGELFGTRKILGGDSEITELSSYGKKVVAEMMINRINEWKES